jgi:hypothetical protein
MIIWNLATAHSPSVPDISLNDFYTHGKAPEHEVGVARKRAYYWVKTLNDKSRAATILEGGEEYVLDKVVMQLREELDA